AGERIQSDEDVAVIVVQQRDEIVVTDAGQLEHLAAEPDTGELLSGARIERRQVGTVLVPFADQPELPLHRAVPTVTCKTPQHFSGVRIRSHPGLLEVATGLENDPIAEREQRGCVVVVGRFPRGERGLSKLVRQVREQCTVEAQVHDCRIVPAEEPVVCQVLGRHALPAATATAAGSIAYASAVGATGRGDADPRTAHDYCSGHYPVLLPPSRAWPLCPFRPHASDPP